MSTSTWIPYAFAALGIGFLCFLSLALLRRRLLARSSRPEEFLLEEAIVVEPLAPGMEGHALLRHGGQELKLRIRAVDEAQAFARGTKVRILDCRDGSYLVEPSDEEHLVH